MTRIFSNGTPDDIVSEPFLQLLAQPGRAWLATAYFTHAEPLLEAARKGTRIQLLVELNPITSPEALVRLREFPDIRIRFLNKRFHAKIFQTADKLLEFDGDL